MRHSEAGLRIPVAKSPSHHQSRIDPHAVAFRNPTDRRPALWHSGAVGVRNDFPNPAGGVASPPGKHNVALAAILWFKSQHVTGPVERVARRVPAARTAQITSLKPYHHPFSGTIDML